MSAMQPHQIAEEFWQIIDDRYPGTAIWWHRQGAGNVWPEWSEAAFDRELRGWLNLASVAGSLNEAVEVNHWARYARFAAGRLRGEIWRRADAPLSHARHILEVLWVTEDFQSFLAALRTLPGWLQRISGVVAGDFWTTIEMKREADGLLGGVLTMPAPQGMDALRWAIATDQAKAAVRTYVANAEGQAYVSTTLVPWVASAHVNLEIWHQRRLEFDSQQQRRPPLVEARGSALATRLGFEVRCRLLTRSGLGARSYARWDPAGEATVYYGATATTTLAMTRILTAWKERARTLHPLSWAIAEPTWVEAGLRRAADFLIADAGPGSSVFEKAVCCWATIYDAVANADAWLWLESGEPDEVARWLEGFMPHRDAWSVVPYLKHNPGRALVGFENYARWQEFHDDPWWGWQWGPIVPDEIARGSTPEATM